MMGGGIGREGCHNRRQILVTIMIKEKLGFTASQQDHAHHRIFRSKEWNPEVTEPDIAAV
ncbi:hypothetical protein KKD49_11885 [Myxococcota bacterium]|nr:hypothetical protein [Myxococcota bacterium]